MSATWWPRSRRSSAMWRMLSTKLYNKAEKHRAYYAVPYKCASAPFHIWGDLVEKAGYKMSDIPNTWDARWDWFKPMQAKLRAKGMRRIYAFGLQMTTNGPSDGNNMFHYFLFANGGQGLVTPDGKMHLDDPKVKDAVVKVVRLFHRSLQGGLHAVRQHQLERRRRQQRLPLQAVRHGSRWHAVHRTGDDPSAEGLRRGGDHGAAEGQRRQADAGGSRRDRRVHPQGGEERRGRQGLHEVLDPAEGR